MTSIDKVDDVERAFLARCLAVKAAGRRALEEMDLDAAFSTELMRRAAHYLAEHLDTPASRSRPTPRTSPGSSPSS